MAYPIFSDELKCGIPQIDRPHTCYITKSIKVREFTEALDVALEFAYKKSVRANE